MAFIFFIIMLFTTCHPLDLPMINTTMVETNVPNFGKGNVVGFDNITKKVLLIGSPYQVYTFDALNQTFMEHPSSRHHTFGEGQFYTQLDHILWVLLYTANWNINQSLNRIDTTSTPYAQSLVEMPFNTDHYGCISSANGYLFIIGSISHNATLLNIYNIVNQIWFKSSAELINPRRASSCIVVNDELYAIGGTTMHDDKTARWDTIESINITKAINLTPSPWVLFNATLARPLMMSRAVEFEGNIMVIGGAIKLIDFAVANPSDVSSVIQYIETATGRVSVIGTLAHPVAMSSPIIVDGILYIFFGYPLVISANYSTYQYVSLQSWRSSYDTTVVPIISRTNGTTDAFVNVSLFIRSTVEGDDESVSSVYPANMTMYIVLGAVVICAIFLCLLMKKSCGLKSNEQKLEDIDMMKVNEDDTKVSVVPFDSTAKETQRRRIKMDENAIVLQSWLQQVVRLPIYYDLFVNNGYESIGFIKNITDREGLAEIGIVDLIHQEHIMKHIAKLNIVETIGEADVVSKGEDDIVGSPIIASVFNKNDDEEEEVTIQ
eukprot:253057_1